MASRAKLTEAGDVPPLVSFHESASAAPSAGFTNDVAAAHPSNPPLEMNDPLSMARSQ